MIGDIVELPLHSERTYIAVTQLTAGQVKTDVPGGPHHLSGLVRGSVGSMGISLGLVSSHCLL